MGVSTDGQICYGISFEEDFEFPWNAEEWDNDIENWWIEGVNAYKPPFEIYTPEGEYLNGVKPSEETLKAYYDPLWAFKKAYPLPVELVNACSGDYPIWIIALPETVLRAYRGDPKSFDPAALVVSDERRKLLIEFCEAHGIDAGEEAPKWWLSSYWG